MTSAIPGDDIGPFMVGVVDIVFALALALEAKGLLARTEIVALLDDIEAQQLAQEGRSTARGAVVHLLRHAFAMPTAGEQVRALFRVIAGGRQG